MVVGTVGRQEPELRLLAPSSYRSVLGCMLVAFLVALTDAWKKLLRGGRASWLSVWGTQFIMTARE